MAQALTATLPYIASIGGSALSGLLGKKGAEDSSALQYHYQTLLNQQNYGYNTKLINMQNAFNERMMDKANQWNLDRWNDSVDLANTAHQREMADLKSAGLNPILSANAGASVVNPIQSAQASSGSSQLSSSAGMPNIDYVGAIQTANSIRNENKRVEDQLKNSSSQRSFVNQQKLDLINQIQNRDISTAFQQKKADAEVKEIEAKIKRDDLLAQGQLLKYASDIDRNKSDIISSGYQNKNLEASTNHYAYLSEQEAEQTRRTKFENDWNANHPILYGVSRLSGPVTAGLTGIAGFGLGKGTFGAVGQGFKSAGLNAKWNYYKLTH